jgi:crotonobetainyl-CoA:carnitine CoA-transferase CaiB-like acyl-CoA transferase
VLDHYRVLDLTDERGQLAGSMLAALGAEVILVEPPHGSHSRRVGPRLNHGRVPSLSLAHWAYNRGKQSLVLDLAADRERLVTLLESADVLITSEDPQRLAALGLLPDDVARINPALVYATITAFGLTGPKANWAATDLTAWASGMSLSIAGDADRAPVRPVVPQAYLHASADAVTGILVALHERHRSGLGQHVDASAQASSLIATQSTVLCDPLGSVSPRRMSGGVRMGPLNMQLVWPCLDGHVAVTLLFTEATASFIERLMSWMLETACIDSTLADKDWQEFGAALLAEDPDTIAQYSAIRDAIGHFTASRSKAELLHGAQHRRVLIAPVNTIDDIAASPQLAARGYWEDVRDPELSDAPIRVPGAFALMSGSPLHPLGPPPALGTWQPATDRRAHRETVAPGATRRPPLDGLKVLDLMWVVAGPTMTRFLADFGATVVRVESATRIDTARTIQPFLGGEYGIERSGAFANLNAGKLSVSLDLRDPWSRAVFEDLLRWADVLTDSFSAGTLERLGYGYETLRPLNPSLIVLSSCLMGQSGPLARFAGFGNLAAAIVGFTNLAGWPDRPPAGPFAAYTDYVSPRYGIAALFGALEHRRRTGEGQHIDLAQAEASLHFLAPALVHHSVAGYVTERDGNRDPDMAPHGVYPCDGDDAWVAIACRDDRDWLAMRALIGDPALDDRDFDSLEGRLAAESALDAAVARWTARLTAEEATRRCQDVGVPAHAVFNSPECAGDPQLAHRGHIVKVAHPIHGSMPIEGPRVLLSRTPGVPGAVPLLGEHTTEVLTRCLGYDAEQLAPLQSDRARR